MNSTTYPIKTFVYPANGDTACPVCGATLTNGQVVLMLNDGASLHQHFHNSGEFDSSILANSTCDILCCSKTCMAHFLLNWLDMGIADKKNSGARVNKVWYDVRLLWIQFDPINVFGSDDDEPSECPSDEYDNYVTPTLCLLEQGADFEEIKQYVISVTHDAMGMHDISESYVDDFVKKLLSVK